MADFHEHDAKKLKKYWDCRNILLLIGVAETDSVVRM